jgi:uncharacterized protein (DUF885 family)
MDTKLCTIEKEFLHDYLELSPILGSHLGLEEWDEMLPEETKDAQAKMLGLLKKTREALRALLPEELTFEEQIDREALLSTIDEQIFEEEELPFARSFPNAPVNLSSALYTIFSRDFSSIEERLKKLTARLERAPSYLESSKELLETPVDLWIETGLFSCRTLPQFITTIVEAAESSSLDSSSKMRLEGAAEQSMRAVKSYEQWLEETILPGAKSAFAIGEEKFQKLLLLKNFGYTSQQLLELGEYYLKTTKETIKRIAQEIDPSLSYDEIKEKIRSRHPRNFDETLEHCRMAMEQSKKYVIDSRFATIPTDETLIVKETPEMFRHTTPLAAYIPPGKFQKEQRGVYIVTRTDDPEVMKDFNYTALFNKSIHEGYPGHHLQFVCCNRHPSPGRVLTAGSEFVEGWAHYCEDYVAQQGFPKDRMLHFTMNLELIWKACRIIIDVKLSSGQMTVDQAVKMLVSEAGFTEHSARAEVHRYTYTPCYQLSYLLGKHLILEMKKELKSAYGDVFSDHEFHDLFLYSGYLPMSLMKKVAHHAFMTKADKHARIPNQAPAKKPVQKDFHGPGGESKTKRKMHKETNHEPDFS